MHPPPRARHVSGDLPDRAWLPGQADHPLRAGTLPPPPAGVDAWAWGHELLAHGFAWEAHEAWEADWRALPRPGPEAAFVQALIHLAAAVVHARLGRLDARDRQLQRARARLSEAPATRHDVRRDAVAEAIEEVQHGLWPRDLRAGRALEP